MYRPTTQCVALFAAATLFVTGASAQAPATTIADSAPTATTATAAKSTKPKKPFTPKSAKGKACSVKADEQNLRGKARKKFRAECMKAA